MTKPKNFIDKLAFIHIVDRKLLVTLNKGKDVWYIPGGKREGQETDQEALIREVKEELSVDLKPDTIIYCGTFEAQAHGKAAGTVVRMTCYMGKFDGELVPDSEVVELDYFSHSRKLESSLVDHLIFDDLKNKGLID